MNLWQKAVAAVRRAVTPQEFITGADLDGAGARGVLYNPYAQSVWVQAAIAAVAGLFNRAGLETRISDDVDSLLWSKLIVNVGINALTALLRVPNGVLAQTPECDLLMARAVAEAVAVARALSIGLDGERQLERVREVCLRTADNRASMLQDILRGRPTEIDAINGAVVARGRAAGVDTPVNLLLTQLVQALEATVADRL